MWIIWHYFWNARKLRNYRILADIIYFIFTYFIFFVAVIASDLIFILGLFGIVTITVEGPFGIVWMLAYALFVAETYISLSLERGEGNLENLLVTCAMYFTYSQLWMILIFRAVWMIIKQAFSKNKEFKWYKTERSTE